MTDTMHTLTSSTSSIKLIYVDVNIHVYIYVVDIAEVTEALFKVNSGLDQEGVRAILSILDLDASNSISFEEFVKIINYDP
jgi:Ca2+-binding EF-hand superfamily protein